MTIGKSRRRPDRKKVEAWLEESLVPVEPSPTFVNDLRARLVTVQGGQVLSPWLVLVLIASMLIFVASVIGFALRLFLGLLGLIGLIERRRRDTEALSA